MNFVKQNARTVVATAIILALVAFFWFKYTWQEAAALTKPTAPNSEMINDHRNDCKEMGKTAFFYRHNGNWEFADCYLTLEQEDELERKAIEREE